MELAIKHGKPVQGSLWSVKYRCARLKGHVSREDDVNSASRQIARIMGQLQEEPKWHTGVAFVITADPSGSDLFEVARASISAMLEEELVEFSVTEIAKVADSIRGFASLVGELS